MTYQELFELTEEDPDEVVSQCQKLLDKNPDDVQALVLMGNIFAQAERFGMCLLVFHRVVELRPNASDAWSNLGMAYEGQKLHLKARDCFLKAWGITKKPAYAGNMGTTLMSLNDYSGAHEWAKKGLQLDPEHAGCKTVLGFTSLAKGDWKTGWDAFQSSLGGKFRKVRQFGEEPIWDGASGKTVAVYGEQGLGDEIMYASCLPDVARDNTIHLECDKRLEGLFKRSFPGVFVHGTRRMEPEWAEGVKLDASCPIAQLPLYFRPTPDSCPGTPYLVADPERRLQWRALFDSWGTKPKIGICWSGGSKHNNPEARNMGLESFRGLIEKYDADWVSLQYKDPTEEIAATGLPVRHFKRACETSDYDDTAALVAELDLVIGVHTSAHHLAGALGVPGLILVPEKSIWIYASETMPWYSSAKLVKKRGEWTKTLEGLADDPFVQRLRP